MDSLLLNDNNDSDTMGHKTKPVGTVETTLRIIEELKRANMLGVSELAESLDVPKSTVHSHLTTLEQNEYLVKEEEKYRLGTRFLGLGEKVRNDLELYELARSELEKIAEDTGELAALLIEEHGKGVFLNRIEGDQAVKLDSYEGYRIYLHTTALGKCILAYMPDTRLDSILERHGLPSFTENTITNREDLEEELQEVKDQGIAYDNEERLRGLRAVAAPILTEDGTVVGSVSIAGPTNRLQGESFYEEYADLVQSAANVIELNITHST